METNKENRIEAIINEIITDLVQIDPDFRGREEELIKIIKKLIESKPDVPLDEGFQADLREKLLKRFDEKKKKERSLWKIIGFSSAAAVVVIILFAVTIVHNPFQGGLVKSNPQVAMSTEEKKDPGSNTIPADEPLPAAESREKKEIAPQPKPEKVTQYKDIKEKESSNITITIPIEAERSKIQMDKISEELVLNYGPPEPMALSGQNKPAAPAGMMAEESFIIAKIPESMEEYEGDDLSALIQTGESNTESYSRIYENEFKSSLDNPLSTFSIDVDTASYANVRRFINSGQLPYPDAVRIEELINYFNYDYPDATGEHPFSFTTELGECPWNNNHQLLHIGIQGKKVAFEQMKPNNLVFLFDVSGSMEDENKLPLLKKAIALLVENLRDKDKVAITVYAGAAGEVLPPTRGSDKQTIIGALEKLSAGGSTAGGEGIKLAYKLAKKSFIKNGNNRVILATDGDFNVGPSSEGELIRLIEEERKSGIYLTVLGFGTGNYKDSMMEQLADKGNGNYAYIDSIMEAKKSLVQEIGGTLLTIAKDVKIQIEFNPVRIQSYRLIGYENRIMAAEDFSDDTKDAGELGSGHTVTALYEIIPASGEQIKTDLKYQNTSVNEKAYTSEELLTLKFRYKQPEETESRLIEVPVTTQPGRITSENFRFSAAVAAWGLLLRDSQFKGTATYDGIIELAEGALGADEEGYRHGFLDLVKQSKKLSE